LLLSGNLEGSDAAIGISSVQSVSISAPCKRDGYGLVLSLLLEFRDRLGVEGNNKLLLFKIPDGDSLLGGSAQPISSGREDQSVDDISSLERVKVLSFIEIPKSGSSVSSSRSAERTIGRNSDCVDVSSVSNQVGSELAVSQVPYLDHSVPSSGDDYGLLRRKSDAADPFGVSLIFDGVLALSKGVPQLDGLVSRSGDDLSVIGRESNAQNVLGVSNESSSGKSSVEIPESESSVPRSRKSELTVRRDDEVLDEVRVSSQRLSGSSVSSKICSSLSSKIPDDNGLVSRSRQEHIRVLGRGSNAGDPVAVSLENSTE